MPQATGPTYRNCWAHMPDQRKACALQPGAPAPEQKIMHAATKG